MDPRTKRALLCLSMPSDLIERIDAAGHTLAVLRQMNDVQLRKLYSDGDAILLKVKLHRQPIREDTIEAILTASGGACAYCADGDSTRPYQIHHISPYAKSQDNSEDNLFLVCPTHHATIHATLAGPEAQKRLRAAWYSLRVIAQDYMKRGLTFAYGACEVISYGASTNPISELLRSSGPVSPATALALAKHNTAAGVVDKLRNKHFAIVSGASGSGKSTLALGVGGLIAKTGAIVLRYRRQFRQDNRHAVTEILQLLSCATRPCLLILEDVNLWLTEADVETIAAATSPIARALATATSEGNGSRLEVHLRDRLCSLTWEDLKPSVIALLVDNEAESAAIMRELRPPDWIERVGFDSLSTSVRLLAERYGQSAQSAWQFMFLMRGGWQTVEQDLRSLVANDRADIPLLFAAVEQIAGIERAVTSVEGASVLRSIEDDECSGLSVDWISKTYEHLCIIRLAIRRRDGFTTTHRDWARAFISAALDNDRTSNLARKLLSRDFDVANQRPRRLMILWSWFYYDTAGGGRFVGDWAKAQTEENWKTLVGKAAESSLTDLGLVASRLHTLFPGTSWPQTLASSFLAHERQIQSRLEVSTPNDWHSIQSLFAALSHAAPAMARRAVQFWPSEHVARLINEANPQAFEDIEWFLAGVDRHSPEWVINVGKRVSWESLSESLRRVAPGKVDDIERCIPLMRLLHIPLMRTRVRRLVDAMRDTLAAATLAEIDFDLDVVLPIEVLPAEMRRVAERLDVANLAKQFVKSGPPHWGRLLMLSVYVARASGDFAERLVDRLDISGLSQSIREEGGFYPLGVRHLLWQLALGKGDRGSMLAQMLLPAIVPLIAQIPVGAQNDILRALVALNPVAADECAVKLGINPVTPDSGFPHKTIFERLPDARALLKAAASLEESGQDYDVGGLVTQYLHL